jgi:chromosome segregation ATPase
MCFKPLKYVAIATVGSMMLGGALFGREVFSYISSSARTVRSAVQESVPVEFQLRRAKDLVADIIPEMQANVRLIAQQEVEIDSLKSDIEQSRKSLSDERTRVAHLRNDLTTNNVSFTYGQFVYTREQLKEDLAHRFDNLKEAEVVLAGKERLLQNRNKSLTAAMQALERTRSQKSLLENQIAALEAQNQLVKAASVGTEFQIDGSKLAQSEKLIREIKQQLDVAERVLAHQASFVEPIKIDVVNEKELLEAVNEHLDQPAATAQASR